VHEFHDMNIISITYTNKLKHLKHSFIVDPLQG